MDLHVQAGTSIVGGHEKERTTTTRPRDFRCSVALGPIPNNHNLI